MYSTLLKDKFPEDSRKGLYKTPALPAQKLGKILTSETRISSPNDVIAMHLNEGFFSSSYVIFTDKNCYYPNGAFLLEDFREFQFKNGDCTIMANQKGNYTSHKFTVLNAEVAEILRKVFQNIQSYDPTLVADTSAKAGTDYRKFEGKALDWLLLRDEIMLTIDLLYDKFNEGKLSLLEYEDKKQQLLDRL